MIWLIFIPILKLFTWITQFFEKLVPIPFPDQVGTTIAWLNGKLWAMNSVFPVDVTIQVLFIVLGFELIFGLMYGFDWYAKKLPGVN